MSTTTTYYGRITISGDAQKNQCIDFLRHLPSTDSEFHPFTKEMFGGNSQHAGEDLSIGFARTYKNMQFNEWLPEFEKLIVQFEWVSIAVIVDTEFSGTKRYEWFRKSKSNDSHYLKMGFIEEEQWYFGRGLKDYVELFGVEDQNNEAEEIGVFKELVDALKGADKKPAPFQLRRSDVKDQLSLEISNQGLKLFAAHLLEAYIENSHAKMKKGNTSGYDKVHELITQKSVSSFFAPDSPIILKDLIIHQEVADKNWFVRFAEAIRKILK